MWPNLTMIRGERPRFPWPDVESLDRVLEFDPKMLVPSHFEPINDREAIRAGVRLGALRALLEASGEVNHYETRWLRDRIEKTRAAVGE
jgi:hypothetical protein